MSYEKLLERAEAYRKLLDAVRRCSSSTKKEIVEELKQNDEGGLSIEL